MPNRNGSHTQAPRWKSHLADWAKYTAAAGAALSMATVADADTIFGNPDKTISFTTHGVQAAATSAAFGLPGAAIKLQNFTNEVNSTIRRIGRAEVAFAGLGIFGAGRSAHRFTSGQNISGLNKIIGNYGILRQASARTGHTRTNGAGDGFRGNFNINTTGIVGFTIKSGPNSGDLGWMKVKIEQSKELFPDSLEVISWAYNTVPGAAIAAGDEGTAATPEPGTLALGLLATGAAGILALRRRRRKEVQPN